MMPEKMPGNKNHFKFFCTASNGFIQDYKYNGYVDELFHDSFLVPCQYTGLKDKNGNDVYENDLIRLDRNGFGESRVGKIGFKHGSFCVEFLEHKNTLNFNFLHQVGQFEIIGCYLERNMKE